MTIQEITARDALAVIEAGAFLLDVRNDDEWNAGHAPSAHYVTLSEVPTRCSEIPRDRDIVVVCRAGGRSLKAAEFLESQGFNALNLSGGMQSWEASSLEIIDRDGNPGTVI